MWGQGLKRADRFSWRIAKALAADAGKKLVLVADRPRSGAEILAGAAKREGFVDTHPQLFKSRTAAKRFIDGDQSAATKLYGEIPATFPSVTWQVEVVDDEVGRSIDVALVSGGANDIGFDDVINP
jgi:NAD(P)-dependent dehydrogenase (short-subunit alcohol dehydrogenase family)